MLISIKHKLLSTLAVFLLLCCGYYVIQRLSLGALNLITDLDRAIPFVSVFVWPYLSLFAVIGLTFIFVVRRRYVFVTALLACVCATVCAIIMYTLFPASYALRPQIIDDSISSYMCSLIYEYDPPNNSFPSLHVAYAIIVYCIFRISVLGHIIWLNVVYMLWTISVIASTVLIKQHHIIDVFSGMIIGYMSFLLARRICNAKK